MVARFYVYVLFRPSGLPCYVGKGQGDRWLEHERGATNPHLENIIKKSKAEGRTLFRGKVAEGLTKADAFALEMRLIKEIGRAATGGPLVNLTDGGDGPSGYRHTEETKRRVGEAGKGRHHTPEAREKIRAAHTGAKRTEEARLAMSMAQKGREVSAEHRAKIRETLKGRRPSPEHMERLRLSN